MGASGIRLMVESTPTPPPFTEAALEGRPTDPGASTGATSVEGVEGARGEGERGVKRRG